MLSQFSLSEPQQQSSELRSSKRARLVCARCHEKKVKCDLQLSNGQTSGLCSNCKDAGCPCQLRPSRRGTAKRTQRADQVPGPLEEVELPSGISNTASDIPSAISRVTDNDNSELAPVQHFPLPVTSTDSALGIPNTRPRNTSITLSPSVVQPVPSFFGNTGYMQIFSHGDAGDGSTATPQPVLDHAPAVDNIPPAVQEGHLDAYYEYGQLWCPVLDRETYECVPEFRQSLLLNHALAICGNELRPSLIDHTTSLEHYNRAKELFYGNQEANPLIRIISIMLFYWWSPGPPNVVSMDTTWWWTGIAIRLAQQIGLHREPSPGQSLAAGETPSLRRRIWWTLVARERITALSQGRPCIIDLADCDTRLPAHIDFPNRQEPGVSIFISWLSLCEIIGRIGIYLKRNVHGSSSAIPLVRELIVWVQSLSISEQPGIGGIRTKGFHREVHGLHLTYLSSITLVYLNSAAQPLPKASTAAMVAASCTARIFQDYLLRGSVRFLAGQAGWYMTMAILALLHARTFESLRIHADADIQTLRTALKEMAQFWHSAKMFQMGINKIMDSDRTHNSLNDMGFSRPATPPALHELSSSEVVNWLDLFPYVTPDTSPLIALLFANSQAMGLPDLGWTFDFPAHLNEFFSHPEDFNVDFFSFQA